VLSGSHKTDACNGCKGWGPESNDSLKRLCARLQRIKRLIYSLGSGDHNLCMCVVCVIDYAFYCLTVRRNGVVVFQLQLLIELSARVCPNNATHPLYP